MAQIPSSAAARIARVAGHMMRPAPTAGGAGAGSVGGMLEGQVAIITGSGQGIGAAAALLFAQHGAAITVCDIDATKAQSTASSISAAGGRAIVVAGDVMDPTYADKVVAETLKAFGKVSDSLLTLLFSVRFYSGYLDQYSREQRWLHMGCGDTQDDGQAMEHNVPRANSAPPSPSLLTVFTRLDCHATAPFRLIRALASHFRSSAETNKVVINISSTSGLHGNAGQLNYSAAKSAVLGMTKTIAKEWGSFGVRCNAVAFGFIDTRLTQSKGNSAVEVDGQKVVLGIPDGMRDMAVAMIPLQRHGTPEEAAGGILMLVSPYAAYVSGHTLEVTGGFGI